MQSLTTYFKTAHRTEAITYICLFSLPILSLSLRHWLSGWFSILALISIATFLRNLRAPLERDEKILLWIFAAFLAVFTLSATLNGWTESSIRRIGTEFKYLVFIPLYYLLRRQERALDFLLAGIILGGIVLGLQAVYDTLFTTKGRGWGIYGPIVFGDLAALFLAFGVLTAAYQWSEQKLRPWLVASIGLSTLAVYLSGNRNGWLAAIILLAILPFLWPKRSLRRVFSTYAVLVLLLFAGFGLFQNPISDRATRAFNQFTQYFRIIDTPEFHEHNLKGDSVGFRLEQWRVALIVFRDAPWFGHGGGNAARVENEYVKRGIGHPDLYNPKSYTNIGGLHSTYFETLVNEGMVGIIVLLLFLGFPLFSFIRYRNRDPLVSSLGIVLILGYMIFGLTENPFVHDNFSSFYLTTLAVLFSTMVRRIHQPAMTTNAS